MDSLKGVLGGHHNQVGLAIGFGKMHAFRTFTIGKPGNVVDTEEAISSIKFKWVGERSLQLTSVGNMTLSFQV